MQIDSLKLACRVKKISKDKRLTIDGKIGAQTVQDVKLCQMQDKFNRIAITMDRYKMLV